MGQRQTLSIGQLLPRPTFGDTGSTMSACFLCLLRYICRCETDPYAVFTHHTKSLLGNQR